MDPEPVMAAAALFLAARPRSVSETARRLRHLGYPDALVDIVVDRMAEMGYLNDAEFARAWVESRDRSKPRGEVALRRELAMKGVPRGVVDQILVERLETTPTEGPDRAAARSLIARRRAAIEREPDPYRRKQKAYALLARNGFDPDTCREITSAFVSGEDTDE